MNTINYINASLEIFSCVLAAIVSLCLIYGRQVWTKCGKLYLGMLACNAGSQFFDAMALYFRGNTEIINWWGVRISNFVSFALNYLLLLVFIHYLTEYIREKTKVSNRYLNIARVICGASLLLLVATQFVPIYYYIDAQNMYHRASFFWVSQVSGIVGMVICMALLLRHRAFLNQTEKLGFWAYILMPMVALFIQIFSYGLVLVGLANTVCLTLIFLFLQTELGRREAWQREQIASQEVKMMQQEVELAKEQAELADARIAIMQSQINPHFIYNTLGTIQYFCEKDPKQAAYITQTFSRYLRGNFGELNSRCPVTLRQEMEHVQYYTAIEMIRFPDMQVNYDIQEEYFMLPALSIQPLVENAIKHGLMGLKKGGTVTIRTWQTADCYCVEVADNGVGFDESTKDTNRGHAHIGISNIRERLKMMCDGTLTITSRKGEGTTALITLPKEKKEDKRNP